MFTSVPLLPSRTRVICDPARAIRRIQGLTMKKVTAETLNELLGIPELDVIEYGYEHLDNEMIVHIICKHRHDVAVCPRCSGVSAALHESEMRCVRHLDVWGKMTFLHFPSRRFDCDRCKKPFTETLPWIEEKRRQTSAFERHIYQRCQQTNKSAVAQSEHLHFKTVSTIFIRWAKRAECCHHRPLLRRLGVDEISLKKGAWPKLDKQIAHRPLMCQNWFVKDQGTGGDPWAQEGMISQASKEHKSRLRLCPLIDRGAQ